MSDVFSLLGSVPPFSQMGEADLRRLIEKAEVVELAAGHPLFSHGDTGDRAYVIVEGQLEVTAPGPLQRLVLNICGPGDLVGESSLLRGTTRSASVTARTDATLLAIGPDELQKAVGAGAGALVRTLFDRWDETRNHVLRAERMAQLGTLAAGIAHELNNPAAAVRRSADLLAAAISRIGRAALGAVEAGLSEEGLDPVIGLIDGGTDLERLDPLERAEREQRLRSRLAASGVEDDWRVASDAVDAGVTEQVLEELLRRLPPSKVDAAVELASAIGAAHRLAGEIGWAAGHMSQIAGGLGAYSRLGEAPVQDVDVVAGLEHTLALVAHRLDGIEVVKELDPDLPAVPGSGSELNQVWTNLIANAADATGPGGRVVVRARREGEGVVVEVEDDGPGIAPDDLQRIFDAFFTTKPPGSGVGLGLSISHKIVTVDHRGELTVESRPGRTVFRAFLPVAPVGDS